jgi:hypothetical protein
MTANINVTHYLVWFDVQTDHGEKLEFVLRDAEERKGGDYGYYTQLLSDALAEAFKDHRTDGIEEDQAYGNISYCLRVRYLEDLPDALVTCEQVVSAWAGKYNINRMKA